MKDAQDECARPQRGLGFSIFLRHLVYKKGEISKGYKYSVTFLIGYAEQINSLR